MLTKLELENVYLDKIVKFSKDSPEIHITEVVEEEPDFFILVGKSLTGKNFCGYIPERYRDAEQPKGFCSWYVNENELKHHVKILRNYKEETKMGYLTDSDRGKFVYFNEENGYESGIFVGFLGSLQGEKVVLKHKDNSITINHSNVPGWKVKELVVDSLEKLYKNFGCNEKYVRELVTELRKEFKKEDK